MSGWEDHKIGGGGVSREQSTVFLRFKLNNFDPVVHSLRGTLKNQKRFYASFLTWHRTGKGAPGVNLFLNLPGPPGSQIKINVYVQQFT